MSNPASKAFSKLIRNLKVALGRAERAKKTVEKAKIPTLAARRRKSEAAKNANKAKLAAYEGAVDKLDQHARQAEELADRILKTGKDVKNRLAKEAKKKGRRNQRKCRKYQTCGIAGEGSKSEGGSGSE